MIFYQNLLNRTLNSTFNRTINNTIMLTANDIKTRGVKAIDEEMEKREEVGITVRGKVKYVVVPVEKYDEFREWELDKAIEESKDDIRAGRFTTSLEEHFEELAKEIDA